MSKRAIDTLCLLSSAAFIGLMTAPAAHAQSAKTYNIPPKPLSAALNDFAAQSQEPILATGELVNGKTSPGASGISDAPTALTHLLEGTGLTYRRSGRTFLIVRQTQTGALPITRIATQEVAPVASAPARARANHCAAVRVSRSRCSADRGRSLMPARPARRPVAAAPG